MTWPEQHAEVPETDAMAENEVGIERLGSPNGQSDHGAEPVGQGWLHEQG